MPHREEHIEHLVRQRLAGALNQRGVGFDRVAFEVLYLLPPIFLDAYIELYSQAFQDVRGGGGNPNAQPIGRKPKGGAPAATHSTKKYREHWLIKNEVAFARKRRIDKKLVKMVREIRTGEGEEKHRKRCTGCGRWAEKTWSYCGWCGEQLRGVQIENS